MLRILKAAWKCLWPTLGILLVMWVLWVTDWHWTTVTSVIVLGMVLTLGWKLPPDKEDQWP